MYGASPDHLSRLVLAPFYHGNAYLIRVFVHEHPQKVRRVLRLLFRRVYNRDYNPSLETVRMVRLIAQNIDDHNVLQSFKEKVLEKNALAVLPLMYMAMNRIEKKVAGVQEK